MSRKHKIVLGILGAIVLLDIFFFFLLCTSDSNGKNSPPQAVTEQTGQTQTFSRDGDGLYEWTGSFVLDAAGMLSAVQNEELAGYLLNLNDTTGVQIAVLTVPTTDGEPIHDFAVRHFEKWQLGQEGTDNGALLTVALADRKTDITTGDGTEGVLTDILCKKILDDLLAPAIREEKYGEGITSAVRNMAGIITQDDSLVTSQDSPPEEKTDDPFGILAGLAILALGIIPFYILFVILSRLPFMIFDIIRYGPPDSAGEFFEELFFNDEDGIIGLFSFGRDGGGGSGGGGSSSSRSGGGGRTSGGGASSSW